MSELFNRNDYQNSALSLSDSLARICRLLENEKDLKVSEVAYFMKQAVSSGLRDPQILSLKTSKVFFQATKGETGLPSWERLPSVGMMVNGNYLIQGGFSPKIESGFTLSDILEKDVDPKYFLSEKQQNYILDSGGGKYLKQSTPTITKDGLTTDNEHISKTIRGGGEVV
jgi:hypothetical protein